MAPSRKRKSDEMAEPTTPEASSTPASKKMRITQTQKQALIDNLQLEITERARHLRAQYALQRADLRSRIERRINRIPMSMRTMTMGELMAKHVGTEPAPQPKPVAAPKPQSTVPPASRQTRKQKSSIVIAADPITDESDMKEEDTKSTQPAPLPKSRNTKRPGSRAGKTGGVLSPRSHNSRTLPRSPVKPAPTVNNQQNNATADCQPTSPTKPIHFTRPHSPLKPTSPLKSAAMATTSAITSSMHNILATAKSTATRGKPSSKSQTQPSQRTVSQASSHSVASNTTTTSTGTVVKGTTTAGGTRSVRGRTATTTGTGTKKSTKAAATAAAEKPQATTKSKTGTVRRGAAAVKKAVTASTTAAATATIAAPAEPAPGRRILRKRN